MPGTVKRTSRRPPCFWQAGPMRLTDGLKAARLAVQSDGILLDQTYTAKAMAGLIQGIRDGGYRPGDRVAFFHTGGLAGLLATDKRAAHHDRSRLGS
jgi:hypothetical protein